MSIIKEKGCHAKCIVHKKAVLVHSYCCVITSVYGNSDPGRQGICPTQKPIDTRGLKNPEPNGVRCVLVLPMGSALMKFDSATFREVLHKSVKKGSYVLFPM